MQVAQKINNFITSRHPAAVCDQCIVGSLNLAAHAHSAQITAALDTTTDFVRKRENCSICNNERMVIRTRAA